MSGKSDEDSFGEDDNFGIEVMSALPMTKHRPKFNLARSTTKNELFEQTSVSSGEYDDDNDNDSLALQDFCMLDEKANTGAAGISIVSSSSSTTPRKDTVDQAVGQAKPPNSMIKKQGSVKGAGLVKQGSMKGAGLNRTSSTDQEDGPTATFNIGTFNISASVKNKNGTAPITYSAFSTDLLAVHNEEYIVDECYPEEISKLLDFLTSYNGVSNGGSFKDVSLLESLTVEVLSVIPMAQSALEKILQSHGWNSETLRYESGVLGRRHMNQATIASLRQDLGTLHVTHANRLAASQLASPTAAKKSINMQLMQDSYIHKSYLPDILFIHLFEKTTDIERSETKNITEMSIGSDKNEMSVNLSGFRNTRKNSGSGSGKYSFNNSIYRDMGGQDEQSSVSLSVFCSKFTGACLIVDISGFTRLSCSFCSHGKAGLDKLYHNANNLLVRFVEIVYSFQGDVISFAGDALICVFPNTSGQSDDDDEDMKNACSRALNCANVLKSTEAEGLTSHIAISCGMFRFATLGGYKNQWVYMLNGECLSEISSCVEDAGSREVVITSAVYDLLSSGRSTVLTAVKVGVHNNYKVMEYTQARSSEGARSANRYSGLPTSPEVDAMGDLFVPKPVQDAVRAGTFKLMAELRDVTTLFLKLDSYDVAFHRNPLTLQPFFHMAQRAIADNGGYVRQFLIDDKGCVLIALWGVRSFSYANNHDRAVSTAITIHNNAPRVGHKCSIGIASGNVFCGNVGSMERRDFVAIGDKVNLAARLMGKAKGEIYVEQVTHASCAMELRKQMECIEPMQLKGVQGLTTVYKCNAQCSPMTIFSGVNTRTHFIRKNIVDMVVTAIKRLKNANEGTSIKDMLAHSFSRNRSLREDDHSVWNGGYDNKSCSGMIVEGAPGSGKDSVVSLALASARRISIESVYLELKPGHKTVDFGTLRELFVTLVGTNMFETRDQQEIFIKSLVNMFPTPAGESSIYARGLYAHMLGVALGLPWVDDGSYKVHRRGSSNVKPMKISDRDDPMSPTITSRGLEMVLCKALQLLLSTEPRVIVVDNMQYADESSWKGFYTLLNSDIRGVIIMTLVLTNTIIVKEENQSPRRKPGALSHSLRIGGQQPASLNRICSSTPRDQTDSATTGFTPNYSDGGASLGRAGLPSIYTTMVARNQVKRIYLAPLTEKETQKYVCQALKCTEISATIVDAIMQLSSGNMYWIKEAALYIAEQGEEAFLSTLRGSTSPLTVLIMCRLEKLSFAAQAVLKYASVIGEEFDHAVLASSVPPQFQHSLNASLDTLIQFGFISVSNEDPLMFKFLNQTIRSELYEVIPVSESAVIHTVVADQILACSDTEALEFLYSS